ncbi:MAG: MerR family transcriptional regulator, partial [Sediminibacterium sp.]
VAIEKEVIRPSDPIIAEQVAIKKNTAAKQVSKRGRKSFKEMDNEADLIDVPDDEVLHQKLYYSISEVAGWFKVNTSLLRYWENEFDILQPRKTRKGDRLFRVEDIKNLQLIYFLLRQRKFSIDGAKNYLKNNKQEADTQARLVESLTKFRSFLLELKSNLHA